MSAPVPAPAAAAAPAATLERVQGWVDADGVLRLQLGFAPAAGGAPAAPPEVGAEGLRLLGPAGPVPVLALGPSPLGAEWLYAVAGAGAAPGTYTLQLLGEDAPGTAVRFAVGPPVAEGAPVEEWTPPPASIDYLAKDWTTFRAAMLDRMAATLPAWTERSPADMGVMLVELLAYAADGLSYYQDAAGTEAYLGTARLRTSLSRHARLLDYRVSQGCSARTWVQVRVAQRGVELPAGTRLYTRTAQDAAVLVPGAPAYAGAMREGPLAFETMEPLSPDPAQNEMALYTWGTPSYTLAAGATSATLTDAWVGTGRALAALRPGQVLVLQEQIGAGGGSPDPAHRQAVRLTRVQPRVLPGQGAGEPVVEVEWYDDDALAFPLVVSGTGGRAPYTGGAVALGNLVLADHGATVGPWELPAVTGTGPYRPFVPVSQVSRRPRFNARTAAQRAASEAVPGDPGLAVGEVWLTDGAGRRWTAHADLLRATPFSRAFVVEAGEEGTSTLRFGDGAMGMMPPPGTRFSLRCRVGLGVEGNVGRDVLAHLQAPAGDPAAAQRLVAAVLQVRNPLPATGGAPLETVPQVRLRAPQAYQVQLRGVTPDDWVALAQGLPGVRGAGARAGWEAAGPQDCVWVQRMHGVREDPAFLAQVRERLEPYRPAGRSLRVLPPRYVGVQVELWVQLEARTLRSAADQALRAALGNGPGGVFARDAFTFGESVWLSRIVAAAAAVPGVSWVKPVRLARWEPDGGGAWAVAEELPMGGHEVARMSGDPHAPWNGSLTLDLQGGIG